MLRRLSVQIHAEGRCGWASTFPPTAAQYSSSGGPQNPDVKPPAAQQDVPASPPAANSERQIASSKAPTPPPSDAGSKLTMQLLHLTSKAKTAAAAVKLQFASFKGSVFARSGAEQAGVGDPAAAGPGSLRDALNKVQKASQVLNELTGYTGVEALKQQVVAADQALHEARRAAASSKQAYEAAVAKQIQMQKDMNKLLERKARWSDEDVQHFAVLCREEGKMSTNVTTAHDAHEQAVAAVEQAQAEYLQAVRERYTEEQLWGDKIRRAATWYTWGLMGLQLLSFVAVVLVVEPRRVRLLQERVSEVLDQHESHTVELVDNSLTKHMTSLHQLIENQRADVVMQALDGSMLPAQQGTVDTQKAADTSKMMSAVVAFMDGVHQELTQQRLQLQHLDGTVRALGAAVTSMRQLPSNTSPEGSDGLQAESGVVLLEQLEPDQQQASKSRKQLSFEQMVGVTAAVSASVGAVVGVLLVSYFSSPGAK